MPRNLSSVAWLDQPDLNEATISFLLKLRNDPLLAHQLINRAAVNTPQSIIKWVQNRLVDTAKKSLLIIYACTENDLNEPVGYVTYDITDSISGIASIGICISQEHHSKGFGTLAVGLLISYLHESFGVKKFVAEILESNLASRGLFCKLGFREVGTMQDHFYSLNKYHNVCIYERRVLSLSA